MIKQLDSEPVDDSEVANNCKLEDFESFFF